MKCSLESGLAVCQMKGSKNNDNYYSGQPDCLKIDKPRISEKTIDYNWKEAMWTEASVVMVL